MWEWERLTNGGFLEGRAALLLGARLSRLDCSITFNFIKAVSLNYASPLNAKQRRNEGGIDVENS